MLRQSSHVVDERHQVLEGSEASAAPVQRSLSACDLSHPRRAAAEAFVRARFQRAHGADIVTFMPVLLLMEDPGGAIDAVLGCRRAQDEPLYLERYLSLPIEAAIAMRTGARVRRSQVVELGNFAAANSRVAGVFMSCLAPRLLGDGLTWIAFTATESIRRILTSLGGRCTELGAADGTRAVSGPDRWGRYYSSDPRVMSGYLPLARRIPALWNTAHAD